MTRMSVAWHHHLEDVTKVTGVQAALKPALARNAQSPRITHHEVQPEKVTGLR